MLLVLVFSAITDIFKKSWFSITGFCVNSEPKILKCTGMYSLLYIIANAGNYRNEQTLGN